MTNGLVRARVNFSIFHTTLWNLRNCNYLCMYLYSRRLRINTQKQKKMRRIPIKKPTKKHWLILIDLLITLTLLLHRIFLQKQCCQENQSQNLHRKISNLHKELLKTMQIIWFEDCIFQRFNFAKNAFMKNEWRATANTKLVLQQKSRILHLVFLVLVIQNLSKYLIEGSLVIWNREILNPQSYSFGFAFQLFLSKPIIADVLDVMTLTFSTSTFV